MVGKIICSVVGMCCMSWVDYELSGFGISSAAMMTSSVFQVAKSIRCGLHVNRYQMSVDGVYETSGFIVMYA